MREKLIELIRKIVIPFWAEQIADHLIANDVVPVVRCKDCTWGKTWKNAFGSEGFKCDLMCVDLSPEAFCSYGERKDGDG